MFRFLRRLPIAFLLFLHAVRGKHRLFDLTFELAAKVAVADGAVDPTEVQRIEQFVVGIFGFSPEVRLRALEIVRTRRNSPRTAVAVAREIAAEVRHRSIVLEAVLDLLVGISFADGDFSQTEADLIEAVATSFGLGIETLARLEASYLAEAKFVKARPQRMRSSVPPHSFLKEEPSCYAVLGCKSTDSMEAIKKQYRKLAKELHPDTAIRQSTPVEFLERTEARFRQVQRAYEEIHLLRK